MRRALSSESGFLGFLERGFGLLLLLLLPVLRVHGSGEMEQWIWVMEFGFLRGG